MKKPVCLSLGKFSLAFSCLIFSLASFGNLLLRIFDQSMNIRGVFHIDLWMIRTRGGMVFDSVFHPSVAVIVLLARTILISDLRTRVNITVTAVGIFGKASFLKAR